MAGTFKAPGKMRIPQWSIIDRLLTAEDVTYDQYGREVAGSRVRTDLTGGVIYFTVTDDDGTIVIQKDSTDVAEIEIKDQLVAATKGQATVHFVYADTAPLNNDPKFKYWFDAWVMLPSGIEEPIVDRGRFYVDRSVTHIAGGPAPALPTYPAPQTPQERSFLWTWSATGTTDVVTIPSGGAMVDTGYGAHLTIEDVPTLGSVAVLHAPSAGRTTTAFTIIASGPILIGTTVNIFLRDRA